MLITKAFKTCYLYFLLGGLATYITACESNLNLIVTDSINLPVVNCILNTDEFVSLQLTRSLPLQSVSDSSFFIRNASIQLFQNGLIVDTLVYNEFKYYNLITGGYSSLKRTRPVIDDIYQLKVTIPGYKDIYSATSIPQPVSIISVDTNMVYLKNGRNTYKVIEFSIKFNDPAQSKNYYKVSIERSGLYADCFGFNCTNVAIKYKAPLYCQDNSAIFLKLTDRAPGFMSFENDDNDTWFREFFMADDTFNGKPYELKVLVPLWWLGDSAYPPAGENTTNRKAYVKLYSINEDYYKYSSSSFNQLVKKSDLFSEPVQVYSKIENGIGIFSGASVSIDSSIIVSVFYSPRMN